MGKGMTVLQFKQQIVREALDQRPDCALEAERSVEGEKGEEGWEGRVHREIVRPAESKTSSKSSYSSLGYLSLGLSGRTKVLQRRDRDFRLAFMLFPCSTLSLISFPLPPSLFPLSSSSSSSFKIASAQEDMADSRHGVRRLSSL